MRVKPGNIVSFIFTVLFLYVFSNAAAAKDVTSETQWFISVIQKNNGKTFCPPPSATVLDGVNAIAKFSKAHPELHDQLTEQQVVQGLSEAYPCTVQMTPELQKTELSKLGAKNIVVPPTGEYASIDTKPALALMQKLYNTTGHENDDLINQIIHNSGGYMPPVLFGLANLFYKQGDTEKAIFWFNAARLRSIFDARLCTDESARTAVPALVQQMPKDLIKKQYDDPIQLKTTIDRVIKWDETTPYNYDHRWISLHGIGAISSGLTPTKPAGPLTVPRESWDTVAQKNREEYRAGINQALTALAKQSSASMTSPQN